MHYVALQDERQPLSTRPITEERCQSLLDIPIGMWYGSSAVIGDKIYFMPYDNKTVHEFCNNQWNKLPSCPNSYCTIVNVDDMLTTVGGEY